MKKRVVLSFSCGKDSIAAWLKMREDGRYEIIPVYYYIYPWFHERELEYYEDFFKTKINVIPSERYISYVASCCWMPPHRVGFVDALELKIFRKDKLNDYLLKKYHAEEVHVGIKKNDSLDRRVAKESETKKFPIHDLSDAMVIEYLEKYGVKLPRDYGVWGCSLDGYTAKWTGPLKEKLPEDYERALKIFPLLGVELKRYEKIKDRLPNYARMDWRIKKYANYVLESI